MTLYIRLVRVEAVIGLRNIAYNLRLFLYWNNREISVTE